MFRNKFIFDLQRFDNEFVGGGEAAFNLNIEVNPSDENAEDNTEVPNKTVSAYEVNDPLYDEDAAVEGEVYNTTDENGNTPIVEGSDAGNVTIQGLVVRKNSLGVTYFQVVLKGITALEFRGSSDITLSNGLAFQSESGATVNFNLNGGLFTGGSFARGGRFSFGRRSVSDVLYYIEDGISIEPTSSGSFTTNDEGTDLESITLNEAGKVTVNGDYKFEFIDPNGTSATVNIKNATGDIVVQYTSVGDTILDLSGLTSTGNTINVVATGGADLLVPPTAENSIKISGTSYGYDNESGAAQFILNSSGAATGFVFGGNGDVITVPKNASFTYQDEDGNTLTFGISGAAQAYTIIKRADDVYEMQIFGSAVVSDSDTTLTFNTIRTLNTAVSVYFDDAGNILSVDGLDNLGTRDTMAVVSSNVTFVEEGLAIGNPDNPTGYISVGSGDFTYSNEVVTVNSGDTIYSLNGYNLASSGGTVTDINGNTYTGNGYFTYNDDAGITGFVFTNKNDYITVPSGSGINLYYLTQATAVTVPAITETDSITVTLSDVSTAADPRFEISDISAGATIPATAPLAKAIVAEDTDNVITTDINGNVKAIDGINSSITLAAGTYDITINDDYISYTSTKNFTIAEDGKITLKDAASLSKLYINNEDIFSEMSWTLNGTKATYGTSKINLLTVNGIKSTYGLIVNPNDKTVTIDNSALNKSNVTISGGYTLKLASDVPKTSTPTEEGWSLNNNVATYKTEETPAYYKVVNNQIVYTAASGGDTLITVNGVNSIAGLSINPDDKSVTIPKSALNKSNVTISDGYTLALNDDVTQPTTKETWSLKNSTATCKQTTSAGYSLEDNQIIYSKKATKTLATVTGVKSIKGLTLNDDVVTVAKASLNAKKVTVSDGYTLELADDVTQPTTKETWSLKNSTATCKQTTSAGYSLEDNQIIYSKKATKTLATVTGVKSIKGLTLNDDVVTVAKASLNAQNVTVSDGYTLELADDVTQPTTKEAWSLKSSTATYKQTTSAGYSLEDNEIIYSKKATTTLATVKGVKSTKGLTLNDNVITVAKASLNAKKVTVSDGYTLDLADNVTTSTVKNAAWSLKSTTATYKGTATAGYTLASDAKSIAYTKKGTATLATVKGVKSIKGLEVDDKVITVSKSSLGTNKVTLSGDGYTLKLGSDVTEPTAKDSWSYGSSKATLKQTKSAGYTLDSNSKSITYSKATTASTLATIKGAKSTSGLSVSDNVITLKSSALASKVTVSGSYEFDFASDYKNATITGSSKADTITARGSNIKLNGSGGNDSLSGGKSNDSINGGAGNDIIFGNKGADTLVGSSGNDSLWGGAGNDSLYGGAGKDTFIYKPGEGTDTIFDYQNGDILQILKSDGSEGGSFTDFSFKNSTLTLSVDGGGSVIFNGVKKSSTFNINGDSYKISSSKLIQK